ncbi:MAG: PaaI family thioesterase [Betaproteobacteria bacterium]|nr:PaaI family thioesterase [Betaproteobacteria bacterium]
MAEARAGFYIHVPFVEHLGLQILEKGDGVVRLRFDPRPEFANSWGSIHGGALMTLLDVALASAGRSLDDQCNGALTVEIKVNFIAAALGPVFAEGRAQRAGRSLIFSEGELRGEDGSLLAKATGTFKLLYPSSGE